VLKGASILGYAAMIVGVVGLFWTRSLFSTSAWVIVPQAFRSVGEALGSTEEAARKRVNRALEKLRSTLQRRGVTLSAAALGTVLGAEAVTAPPAGLAASVLASALAGATAVTDTAFIGVKLMAMTKLKLGIVGAIAVATVTRPWVLEHQARTLLREKDTRISRFGRPGLGANGAGHGGNAGPTLRPNRGW
jgi:hypothetical protein